MRTKPQEPATARVDLLSVANDPDNEIALPPKRPPAPNIGRRLWQRIRLN